MNWFILVFIIVLFLLLLDKIMKIIILVGDFPPKYEFDACKWIKKGAMSNPFQPSKQQVWMGSKDFENPYDFGL